MDSKSTVSGSARPQCATAVNVNVSEDYVKMAAEVATTVIMQQMGTSLGSSFNEVFDFNVVSLKAALIKAIDGDAVVDKVLFTPVYFSTIIKGMRTKIGRTVIEPICDGSNYDIPESYKDTALKLRAAGVPMVKPHRPAEETSKTLSLFIESIDDVDMLVGNLTDVDLTDLIRRALLFIRDEDQRKLKELSGQLAFQYGEAEVLLADYFSATVKVSIT